MADSVPAYHPHGGHSYTHRSPQGLHGQSYGKREAESSYGSDLVTVAHTDYGYHPTTYTYGHNTLGSGYNKGRIIIINYK